MHKLEVKVGDAHVKGSPLAVTCEPGPIHVPRVSSSIRARPRVSLQGGRTL